MFLSYAFFDTFRENPECASTLNRIHRYIQYIFIFYNIFLTTISTKFEIFFWEKIFGKWVIVVLHQMSNFSAWWEQITFEWDDVVSFVLDQHAYLNFYSGSWLKQQSVGRLVSPLWHIILIPREPVFALTPLCCMFSRKVANTYFMVFRLTW
jgi:hypothetical protein